MVLTDGVRSVELYRIHDSHHYRFVPDRLSAPGKAADRGGLIYARSAEFAATRQLNRTTTNLVDNLQSLRLSFDKIRRSRADRPRADLYQQSAKALRNSGVSRRRGANGFMLDSRHRGSAVLRAYAGL